MRKREASVSLVSASSGSRDSLLCRRQQCVSVMQGCAGSTGVYRARRAHKVVHAYLGDLISSTSFVVGGLKLGYLGENPTADQKSDCLIVAKKPGNKNGRSQGGNSLVASAKGHMCGTRGRKSMSTHNAGMR